MTPDKENNGTALNQLIEQVKSLEKRIAKMESELGYEWAGHERESSPKIKEQGYTVEKAESNFTQYGLAWLGSFVFFFAIAFLMSYVASLGHIGLSRLVAYIATIVLLGIALLMRKSFATISDVLTICCSILIYYTTLKLYFFTQEPIINNIYIVVALLVLIAGIQLYLAVRKFSEGNGALAITYLGLTALLANTPGITFPLLLITSLTTLVFFNTHLWWKNHLYSLFLVYFIHLVWLFGNPAMGGSFRIVEDPGNSLYYLIAYSLVFVASVFIPKERLAKDGTIIAITIWNTLLFSLFMLVIIPVFYKETYAIIFTAIAIFYMTFSIIMRMQNLRDFAPATFASIGFMALSIALYGYAGLPKVYFLLVLQSFLVVSIALWYKSRLIIIANTLLFLMILIAYFVSSESLNTVNFALAITGLGTARILNWQKERLTLKTDIYRNVYLIIGAAMLLYGFSKALPQEYVTIAWTACAVAFFILSQFLKLVKYRYIAIATIIITAGHLFFIDLNHMAVGFRVVAFLIFAVISLGLSLYFTNMTKNGREEHGGSL